MRQLQPDSSQLMTLGFLDCQQLRMTGDKQRWERLASYCVDFGLVASPAGRYKSDRGSTLISSRG